MVDPPSFRRPVRPLRLNETPDGPEPFSAEDDGIGYLPPTPETLPEQQEGASGGEQGGEALTTSSSTSISGSGGASTPSVSAETEKMQKQIESILSNGLDAEFRVMTPVAREQFRTEGEKTAFTIRQLIEQSKATARKVLELIRNWLTLIPGINRFFLEQEAKIKTDKVLELIHPHEE